jgi:hypothetical protein
MSYDGAVCMSPTVLLCGCAVVVTGCSSSSSTSTLPPGWVTFEGESISLALPDSFAGGIVAGDRTDPVVIAEVEKMGFNPDLWVVNSGFELFMFAQPNADGYRTIVTARRQSLPSTTSMDEAVELLVSELGTLPGAEVKTETVAEDRAYMVVRSLASSADQKVLLQHIALRREGSYLYDVRYTFDDESNTSLDSVFRTSAETIVVKER